MPGHCGPPNAALGASRLSTAHHDDSLDSSMHSVEDVDDSSVHFIPERRTSKVTIREPSPRLSGAEEPPPHKPLLAEAAASSTDDASEERPRTAALFVVLLSAVMGAIAVVQEKWGSGVEANSARQEGAPPISGVNTLWVIISTALVMLMTPAVSLYYGGMVAEDQVLNRMVRTFVNLGLVGFQWIWVGYSLAFAPSNPYAFNLVGDFSFVVLSGVGTSPAGSPAEKYGVPHFVFVMFQLMFASITTTILSGSVANLMSFKAFCPFIIVWTTVVYDPICHAIWGGGLMSWHLDFAGGLVIHVTSGVSAAAAATYLYRLSHNVEVGFSKTDEDESADPNFDAKAMWKKALHRPSVVRMRRPSIQLRPLGPTTLRAMSGASPQMIRPADAESPPDATSKAHAASEYLDDDNPSVKELVYYMLEPGYTKEREMVWDRALGGVTIAHNRTFVVLGAVLLWFGWFGFNGGSALTPGDVAAAALLNTNIAAGVAMITWMFCEAMCGGNPSAIGAATGAICGLVGVTPCAGYIPALAAGPIGAMSAGCAFGFVWLDKHTMWFNWLSNPLDVGATHGVSGIIGSLLTGIFAFKPVNMDEHKLVDNGLVFGGGWTLFRDGILATLITISYSTVMTILICIMLTKMLGVDGILSSALLPEDELQGSDDDGQKSQQGGAQQSTSLPLNRQPPGKITHAAQGSLSQQQNLRKEQRRRMSIGN